MKFEVYQDRLGRWRWRLKTGNNRTIAASGEAYEDKQDCLNMISFLKAYALKTPVVEA